jgi:pantetheine-phosphate adenylyltransferase
MNAVAYDKSPVVAIYPGTFDPFTLGHQDIVSRAAGLFDRVLVAVAVNDEKNPLFPVVDRLAMIQEAVGQWQNVTVLSFSGLLVNLAREQGAKVVVRGLRAVSDFEYEFRMAQMNKTLAPEVETLFLMASLEYQFLNSTTVKQVALLGGDVSSLVPPCVEHRLRPYQQGTQVSRH